MTRTLSFIYLFWLACSACAPSTSAAPAASNGDAIASGGGEQDIEDPIVCTMERETGSHIRKRVCRSQSQMDAEQNQADELVRRARTAAPEPPMGAR